MPGKFSQQSDLYARYRPEYPQEMYDFLFRHVHKKEYAWDCATGSGQVAKKLAGKFDKVYATDISEEQLKHAPEIDNVRYKVEPAENTTLPDNKCDLITAAQAIHWFDIPEFYREVRRVASADGILAVIGYGMVRISESVNPHIDRLYDEAFNTYFTKSRELLDSHYRELPFPFEEIPTPAFTYTDSWTIRELEGYFNSWSAIQKIKTDEGRNPADQTIAALGEKLADKQNIPVHFPVFLRLGKVRAPKS